MNLAAQQQTEAIRPDLPSQASVDVGIQCLGAV